MKAEGLTAEAAKFMREIVEQCTNSRAYYMLSSRPIFGAFGRVNCAEKGLNCQFLVLRPGWSLGEYGVKMKKSDERTERALRAYTGLVRAVDAVTGLLEMQLGPRGLTLSQGRVLDALTRFGPMSHLNLAKKILRTKSAVAGVVKGLQRRGLVRSRTGYRDRRTRIARVTPRGKILAGEVVPQHTRLVRARMATLGGREQETLARLCEKLIAGDSTKFAGEFVQAGAGR